MQKKTEKFSEKEVAMIIIEVSNALTYLHDVDVVHRDIKPENIVISNVRMLLFRVLESCVISAGQLFAIRGEIHTAGHSIMLLQRYWRENSMITRLICGVSGCWLMSC